MMLNMYECQLLNIVHGKALYALASWIGLMAPKEKVVGSIFHAGVVVTTLVQPIRIKVHGLYHICTLGGNNMLIIS